MPAGHIFTSMPTPKRPTTKRPSRTRPQTHVPVTPTTSEATTRLVRRQLREAARAALGKKAQDLVILDVRKLADFCDYFLLCHGTNPHQIQAIAEAIELQLERQAGLSALQREGGRDGEWVVLDYMHFLVHVFSPRTRAFYDLERLWGAAPRLPLSASVTDSKPNGLSV